MIDPIDFLIFNEAVSLLNLSKRVNVKIYWETCSKSKKWLNTSWITMFGVGAKVTPYVEVKKSCNEKLTATKHYCVLHKPNKKQNVVV